MSQVAHGRARARLAVAYTFGVPSRVAVSLACLAALACGRPSGNTTGLVVVSESASAAESFGPAPECEADSDTGGEPAPAAEGEPGTEFCAGKTSQSACDGVAFPDDDARAGECRWVDVVPVVAGTCDVTQLFRTCVYQPDVAACIPAVACGMPGLAVYGRAGCDGTVELLMAGPTDGFCGPPADWTACAGDDPAPECTCGCA